MLNQKLGTFVIEAIGAIIMVAIPYIVNMLTESFSETDN